MTPRFFILAAFTPAILGAASPLRAEDSSKLGEVVVTATRTAIDTADAPASVSVVDQKDIESRGAVQITDTIKDLPSVYVRDMGAGLPSAWANQVVIRGIPGYYRTAVMVDGQAINNAFSGGVNWSTVDPESVERIEVVRGPFSSLYGGNAMGGAINIITKPPTRREVTAKLGYGSNDLRSAHAAVAERFHERFGLRLDVGYKSSDGYVRDLVVKEPSAGAGTAVTGLKSTQTDTGGPAYVVGEKGKRAWWQRNAGGSLSAEVTDHSLLTVTMRYHEHEAKNGAPNSYLRNATTGAVVTSGNVDVGGGQRVSLSSGNFLSGPNGEEAYRYAMAYEHELAAGTDIKIDAAYADNTYWYVTPNTSATAAGGTGKFVDVPNTRMMANAQLRFPLLDSHFLVTGVSAQRDTLDKREYDVADWRFTGSTTALRYLADAESRTYAAYVQDEWALRNDLTLYVGARYDYWETDGVVEQFAAPAFRTSYSTRSKSALNPKISLVYKPWAETTLRASAGTAFRAPNLSDMYSTWITSAGKVNESNPDLEPETTRAFEIGGEHRFLPGSRIALTAFYNQLEDLIYQRTQPNGDTIKENAGEAVIKGFEVEAEHRLTAILSAFANYTYSTSKITSNPAEPLTVGKKLTYVPTHAASLGVQLSDGPYFGSLVGRYAGKVHGDSQNRDVVDGVYGSYDPYFVVDAKLGYRVADWLSASLAVANVLDEEYYQSTVTPGRTFFSEVTVRF